MELSPTSSPNSDQACPHGNPISTDYILRDDNRCEGIQPYNKVSSSRISLISLMSRGINDNDIKSLREIPLKLPQSNDGSIPIVSVRSLQKKYQFDHLKPESLTLNQSIYRFMWNTYVLKKTLVPVNSLRALAFFNLGSQVVYVPVILGQPSGQYEIVLYSSQLVTITRFEISRNSQIIYRIPRHTPQRGEVVFNWDGRNTPAGRYQLRVVAELEQYGRPPEPVNQQITFEHNPNWLR